MPALLVILIVAFLVLLLLIGFNLLGVLLMLVVAGLVGVLADAIVPGRLPWGFLGAILAGLVGSWLGVALFGEIGPTIFGIPIISAFIGALIVAFVVARPGATVDAAALDALCLANIARYKRPRAYRFVDELPKNNYGKILKTELRARLRSETEQR